MVRSLRGLLFVGLIGVVLLLTELFVVRAVQHTPLPVVVTPEQAKEIAAQWIGTKPMIVRQEENQTVSRHLQERGLSDAFRKEASDPNKPLVMWKVTSGETEVLVNRQNGQVEGVRGATIALVEGSQAEHIETVRKELSIRYGLDHLAVSSIKNEGPDHVLIEFESGYRYADLREVILAELDRERWVAFAHRLETSVASRSWDLATRADEATVSNRFDWQAVTQIGGGYLNLLLVACIVLAGIYVLWKNGRAERRPYGEAIVSGCIALIKWLLAPTLVGLFQALAIGAIVFFALTLAWQGRWPWKERLQENGWLEQQVVAGYGVFGCLAGASTLFLWASAPLGAWVSDLQAQEAIALFWWPFLLPLLAPLSAAVFEELIYRKLSAIWLRRLFKSGVATVLISSLIWSLGHLLYNVSPWYLRVIELSLLIGPLFFFLYRQYGLGAVMIGHFLYNSLLASIALAGAFGSYMSLIWLLLPLLLLVVKKKGLLV
ncbi:hypothetical protein CIG75_06830 [Tumebacillus algifaecis]|uniref:CAAX prenyl protease 2/Lysostaphin resistance protein A-like domain-containing protein n=1 Tax=Tumebacillus algifaecis TaxID=1214604 RepID=A0A223D019_9BACL|nr:type II CAAX endopeptidase family protein [Tumebacillus algifaecis]ASS74714.1 hypothetical protein CIG75_06830 [Tumebacillus algifaecis]